MKHRRLTLLFAGAVIFISIYGILWPSYDLGYFMDLSKIYAYTRILAVSLLVAYVLYEPLRTGFSRTFMFFMGILSLVLGVTALFSPMMLGHLSHYTQLGDVFMALEGGVLYMLSALLLPARKLHIKIPAFISGYQIRYLTSLSSKKLASNS